MLLAAECAAEAAKWENISLAIIMVAACACIAIITWVWRP